MSDSAWPRPGYPIREAHAHLAATGLSLELRSVGGCGSLAECLEIVRAEALAAAKARGAAGWVRMTSARVQGWPEQRWPTRLELDEAARVDGRIVPVVLLSFDYHSAAANTAALEAAGLKAGVPVPPKGTVCETSPGSGEASGTLLEEAAYAAWNACPEPTMAEQRRYVRRACEHLRSLGFVEVHDLHSQPWLGAMLGEMERASELAMKVWLYPAIAKLEEVAAGKSAWESERVRLAGGKVFADGTLNSRTAFMLHRYAEPLLEWPRGHCMVSPAALEEHVRLTDRLGVHLAVHAIGDGAVRTVLDAIEKVGPRGSRTGPYRIEHCEVIDAADVPRFAGLGVVCSVQPCHLLTDIEALNRFVPHRLNRVLPLRELIDSGCRPGELLWFGSDVPIVRADPEDSIRAAVERRREGMGEDLAVALKQRIGVDEAWAAFKAEGVR
jgi:predicted amidohydrolase YtcJ